MHLITSESKYFSSARQKGATSNFKNSKEIVEEHDDWAYGYCSNMNFPENPVDKKKKKKPFGVRERKGVVPRGWSPRIYP